MALFNLNLLRATVRVSAEATCFGEDWARETYGDRASEVRCYGTFSRWQNRSQAAAYILWDGDTRNTRCLLNQDIWEGMMLEQFANGDPPPEEEEEELADEEPESIAADEQQLHISEGEGDGSEDEDDGDNATVIDRGGVQWADKGEVRENWRSQPEMRPTITCDPRHLHEYIDMLLYVMPDGWIEEGMLNLNAALPPSKPKFTKTHQTTQLVH